MKRSTVAWGVAGIGCAFLVLLVGAALLVAGTFSRGAAVDGLGFALGGRVGVVDVEGVILSADRFRETLKRFRDTPNVKAVVVRINSPGGGVAASQELNREIVRFRRETSKPVVVSMESVAASGGYYTAVAADHIVANPGTITGSIGVIIQWVNYGDLLEWAKLRAVTIKSGALKDSGNPTRPITDEDRAYFEDLIQKLRAQFVRGRHGRAQGEAQAGRDGQDGRRARRDGRGSPRARSRGRDRRLPRRRGSGRTTRAHGPSGRGLAPATDASGPSRAAHRRTFRIVDCGAPPLRRSGGGRMERVLSVVGRAEGTTTKADLVEEVAKATELTKKQAEVIVESVFDGIVASLRSGEKIELRGFGSFRLRQRGARIARNPKRSGVKVMVPPKRVPYFKPGKKLKELINQVAPAAAAGEPDKG